MSTYKWSHFFEEKALPSLLFGRKTWLCLHESYLSGLSPRDARVIRWRNRLEMCCTMNPVPASSTESAEIARDASANEVAMPVFDYLLRVVPHTGDMPLGGGG
eukprot:2041606-Pleurochrysis_carterae.AAC.3